jgi:hypothetical protein
MDIPDSTLSKSNTVFHRLNKLATTKLKNFVGGKQLIDLKSDLKTESHQHVYQRKKALLIPEVSDVLKPNLIKILEKKAQKAIDKVKSKHKEEEDEGNELADGMELQSNANSNKINNKLEVFESLHGRRRNDAGQSVSPFEKKKTFAKSKPELEEEMASEEEERERKQNIIKVK